MRFDARIALIFNSCGNPCCGLIEVAEGFGRDLVTVTQRWGGAGGQYLDQN